MGEELVSIFVSESCRDLLETICKNRGESISEIIMNTIVFGRPLIKNVPYDLLKKFQMDSESLSESEKALFRDYAEGVLRKKRIHEEDIDPYFVAIKSLEVGEGKLMALQDQVQFEAFKRSRERANRKHGIKIQSQIRDGKIYIVRIR